LDTNSNRSSIQSSPTHGGHQKFANAMRTTVEQNKENRNMRMLWKEKLHQRLTRKNKDYINPCNSTMAKRHQVSRKALFCKNGKWSK